MYMAAVSLKTIPSLKMQDESNEPDLRYPDRNDVETHVSDHDRLKISLFFV